MKIHPDHVEGIRPDQQDRTDKARSPRESFEDMLSQEVSRGAVTQSAGKAAPPPPLMGIGPMSRVEPPGEAEQAAVARMEGLLDRWEAYADHLGGNTPDGLKQAYAALEDIEAGVAQLKDRLPADSPALESAARELEILSRTEKIKFNRGDYL